MEVSSTRRVGCIIQGQRRVMVYDLEEEEEEEEDEEEEGVVDEK